MLVDRIITGGILKLALVLVIGLQQDITTLRRKYAVTTGNVREGLYKIQHEYLNHFFLSFILICLCYVDLLSFLLNIVLGL